MVEYLVRLSPPEHVDKLFTKFRMAQGHTIINKGAITMGELSLLAESIREYAETNENNDLLMLVEFFAPTHERGVIVKAIPGNDRFEDTSVWISLGDGTYRHLSGEKGLVAKWSRLRGYVKPIYDTKNNVYFV